MRTSPERLTVATLAGVPLSSWLGQHAGWPAAFVFVGAVGLLACAMILACVPYRPGDAQAHPLRELDALRTPQVLLTLLVGAVGFGGMFAVFSYIAPTLTAVAGLPASGVPWAMAAFGVGMILGNLGGAWLADRHLMRSIAAMLVWGIVVMAAFPLLARHVPSAMLGVMLVGTAGALVAGLQIRLMDVAGQAQTLAAALNHSALNIANALGAWLGGMAIDAGFSSGSRRWVFVFIFTGDSIGVRPPCCWRRGSFEWRWPDRDHAPSESLRSDATAGACRSARTARCADLVNRACG